MSLLQSLLGSSKSAPKRSRPYIAVKAPRSLDKSNQGPGCSLDYTSDLRNQPLVFTDAGFGIDKKKHQGAVLEDSPLMILRSICYLMFSLLLTDTSFRSGNHFVYDRVSFLILSGSIQSIS
mgnify:CR=1|jgi:hypothetical protein